MASDEYVMNDDEQPNERAWAADKRDFVADRRDAVADERDLVADLRESVADDREDLADARESELDQREQHIEARAAELALSSEPTYQVRTARATSRAAAVEEREVAHQERGVTRSDRESATAAREQAEKQRAGTTPTTGLAMAFAEIARHLFEADNFDDVLTRVVETAVTTVHGCAMASVTVREEAGTFRTMAASDVAAAAADEAQYEAGEGPCLEAAAHEPVVHAPSLPDPRWPALGAQPVDCGIHGVVSYRLAAPAALEMAPLRGSLNAYATVPNSYDDEAIEIGLILAAHASVVVRAIREKQAAEEFGRSLHQALYSRDVISQAKGILMERLHLTPEEAFDLLRRSSQRLHVKLVEIAQKLTQTGELDNSHD